MEYIGVAFAALEILLKIGSTTYKIIENDKFMKSFSRNYMRSLYASDSAALQLVCDQARGIFRDQSVSFKHKMQLQQLTVDAKQSLEAVHAMATAIDSGELGLFGRNLSKLNQRIRKMGRCMKQFCQFVGGLQKQAAAESADFLLDQDFAVTGPPQHVITLNDYTSLVNGEVSKTRSPEHAKTTRFVLEAKPYDRHGKRTVQMDMRLLSGKLETAQKGQCILPFVGFRDDPENSEYQLVFGVSAGKSTFQTLEAMYRARQTPSLNLRIALCSELAKAVLQTHTLGLVHKNIRPANILLQSAETDGDDWPELFLAGWQYARAVDERASQRLGEHALERAIYQHPERQHLYAEAKYCMGHDIYSLGVCMLELLTWSPLVVGADAEEGAVPEVSVSQAYRHVFLGHEQNQGGNQGTHSEQQLWSNSHAVKRTITRMNEALVPVAAGDHMKRVVEMCLTCLDNAEDHKFFMAPEDKHKREVVISFVDTILYDINLALSVM